MVWYICVEKEDRLTNVQPRDARLPNKRIHIANLLILDLLRHFSIYETLTSLTESDKPHLDGCSGPNAADRAHKLEQWRRSDLN